MQLPINIKPRYLSPGSSNAEYPNCMGMTYFHGQQIIAYGSSHLVVVASISLNVISALDGHDKDSIVRSIAWAPYSGKLSSASTKNDIIIWEPENGGWIKKQVINLESAGKCMSWSLSDNKFCVASDNFSIYQKLNISRTKEKYELIFSTENNFSFCSFSRDSRFILTLTDTNKEVFIWYKKALEKNQYRRIPIKHPSRVKNMQWRTSDKVHDRCSFITIAEDHMVRVWAETGVNETLAFNVVITLPSSYNTISAAFVTSSSRMIKNTTPDDNMLKHIPVDEYAFGHGHMPETNSDFREANVASKQELKRNISRLLTCDSDNTLYLWELSGISTSVRRTPQINLIEKISCSTDISPGDANKMFAVCRLENKLNNYKDKNYTPKLLSLSLILQNQKTNMIENVDVTFNEKQKSVHVVGRTQGHKDSINCIRIHQKEPFMVTIDKSGVTLVWKYDDTDVYDPTVLTKFGCQIEPNIRIADWNGNKRQLVAFEGTYFLLFDIPSNPKPSAYLTQKCDPGIHLTDEDVILDFRYCTTILDNSLFILLTTTDVYVLSVKSKHFQVEIIDRIEGSNNVFGAQAYVSTLFPLPGATIYFYAVSDGSIHTLILDSIDPFKGHEDVILNIKGERIIGIDYAHPGFLFVVTNEHIYIAWRKSSQMISFEVIQTIDINYKPINVVCIATGLFTVISEDYLYMYHSQRDKYDYPDTYAKWICTAKCKLCNITAVEWSLDGILIVAQGSRISAFTKFMDTFFLEMGHFRPQTIHQTFSELAQMPSDYNPMNIYPIAASGRTHLLLSMFKFLLNTYDKLENLGMYTEKLLNMPTEDIENCIPVDEINNVTGPLIELLMDDKIPYITKKHSLMLINLLKHFNELQDPNIKALEPKAQVLARAMILEKKAIIPFDLIILGWQVYNQKQLIKVMNITTWDDVIKSGIIFWCKNLDDLFSVLTPIAVNSFDEMRFLSIILLTLGKKNKILSHMFSKSGDDTRAAFFVRDFNRPKDRKFAEKNAYSALSKHDFHISAAMFFLAGQIESVVRVLLKNLGSYSLAFLACRCIDNGYGKNTTQVINEVFLERASTNKDLAAVEFFNRIIDPSDPIELAPRMTQHIPGFFFQESSIYGDMRFNVCEIAGTTISMKSDYIKSALYMGNTILATLYLPYFSDTIIMPDITSDLPIHQSHESLKSILTTSSPKKEEEKKESPVIDETIQMDEKEEPEEEEYKEEDSTSNIFGGSAFIGGDDDISDYSDYSDYSESSYSSTDNEKQKEEAKIIEQKKKLINNSASKDLLESTMVDNWFNEIVLFNICRYRLEYFLETQFKSFSFKSPNILMIIPEIESVGPQTCSMKDQLHDYLIRSCKRMCFIYRRMLLMSSEEEKHEYILELCRNISLIPDQMLSFHISAQQITQLASTARILIRIINGHINSYEKHEFIVASICTALFIYAFYFQDSKMMIHLLDLDLTNINEFPQDIIDNIKIIKCKSSEIPYNTQNIEKKGSFFSFIVARDKVDIYAENEDFHDTIALKNYTIALVDLMLFKTFVDNIEKIMIDSTEFDRMDQFLHRITDIYVQIFQYAILASPQISKINLFSNIKFKNNDDLNELFQFLINMNNRLQRIPYFCRNLYASFSEITRTKTKDLFVKPRVLKSYELSKIKSVITGIAVNHDKSAIFAISPNSILAYSTDNKINGENESDHNVKLIHNVNNAKVNTKYKNTLISKGLFTKLDKSIEDKLNNPSVIITHPKENFGIVGDKKGYVWGFSHDDYADKFIFDTPNNVPCSNLAVSYDGGMLAASHGHIVSLYSFLINDRFKPCSQYDVWGERITCLEFLKGSGLFACGQTPSSSCKSCITFWDSLLPNRCAMIASVKFGKGIYPTSMDFSPSYNAIIAGCSNGSISMIDTRMFQIVATFKPHTKSISSIVVGKHDPYFLSGSHDGSVVLWDIRNLNQLMVLEQHKNSECIGVSIHKKTIYSLFDNGRINSTQIYF